jgi:hypothetical protein
MDGEEFMRELLNYGVSAISLTITGSTHTEGVRACVSMIPRDLFPDLEIRLKQFNRDHSNRSIK